MGAQYRILLRQADGAWRDVPGAEWKSEAEELSRAQATSAVWSSLLPDQAWLVCFHQGALVRDLRFTATLGAWSLNRGPGMPFEHVEGLALWLRKWRRTKKPLTKKDATALLKAFTGQGR